MQPPVNGILTGMTQIQINWSALPTLVSMGGSQVTSYTLKWDHATNGAIWYNVIGDSPSSLALTTTLTNNIAGGLTYQFKVRARNVNGWGSDSSVLSVKAAQIPGQM